MKKMIMILILILSGIIVQAQTQQDSILKANQQLQLQNDSLKQLQSQPVHAAATSSQPSEGRKDTRPFMQRLSFDISTSFWVNTRETYFEFTPMLTYHFPKTYSVGTGPTYLYRRDKEADLSLHGWGGKVFGRADITRWLYAWTEYQVIDNEYVTGYDAAKKEFTTEKDLVDSWFVSLGLTLRMGKRRGINAQVLYDVLYKESTSPYYSAVIYRVGFGF